MPPKGRTDRRAAAEARREERRRRIALARAQQRGQVLPGVGPSFAPAPAPPAPSPTAPDAVDRNRAARESNLARGAAPSGGPGLVEQQRLLRGDKKGRLNLRRRYDDPRELQRELRRAGFDIAVDGIVGPETRAAYREHVQSIIGGRAANIQARAQRAVERQEVGSTRLYPGQAEENLKLFGFVGASELEQAGSQMRAERARLQAERIRGADEAKRMLEGGVYDPALVEELGGIERVRRDPVLAAELIQRTQGAQPTLAASIPGPVGDFAKWTSRQANTVAEALVGAGIVLGGGTVLIGADAVRTIAAGGDPDGSLFEKHILMPALQAAKEDFAARYDIKTGPLGVPYVTVQDWRDVVSNPVPYAFDAATVFGSLARVGNIGKLSISQRSLRGGVRESFRPTGTRQLVLGDRVVDFQWARHPLTRGGQRLLDIWASKHPQGVVGREGRPIPVVSRVSRRHGAEGRATRQQARMERLETQRDQARWALAHRRVETAGETFKPLAGAARTRLFLEANLPPQARNNTTLGMLRDRLVELRAEASTIAPDTGRRWKKKHRQFRRRLASVEAQLRRTRPGTRRHEELTATLERLQAQAPRYEQELALRGQSEQQLLDQRIRDIEAAMAYEPDSNYLRALDDAAAITDDMERLKSEVMGPEVMETFEGRRGLLARYLGIEGVSDVYMPHRGYEAKPRPITGGAVRQPAGGRIPGTPQRPFTMHENQLELLQSGRLVFDPDHLVVEHSRMLGFAAQKRIRDFLFDSGDPQTAGMPLPRGHFIVDRAAGISDEVRKAIETGSDEDYVNAMRRYKDAWIRRAGEAEVLSETQRIVSPIVVDQLVRILGAPGRGNRAVKNPGAKAWDLTNDIVRIGLLYANPGYYPANLIGNLVFLGLYAHGFALPNLLRSGRMWKSDRELFNLIAGEAGVGPRRRSTPAAARCTRSPGYPIAGPESPPGCTRPAARAIEIRRPCEPCCSTAGRLPPASRTTSRWQSTRPWSTSTGYLRGSGRRWVGCSSSGRGCEGQRRGRPGT